MFCSKGCKAWVTQKERLRASFISLAQKVIIFAYLWPSPASGLCNHASPSPYHQEEKKTVWFSEYLSYYIVSSSIETTSSTNNSFQAKTGTGEIFQEF